MSASEKASNIVEFISKDISGRSGIGDVWDSIDADTKREILHLWNVHITDRLSPQAIPDAILQQSQEDELLVNFGDMRDFTLASLKQIMSGTVDTNHESMVEEHLKAFNYAVTQGIHPGQALFALVQAFAMLQGFAIRSGLRPEVAGQLMAFVMKKTEMSAKDVQIALSH